MPFTEDLTAFFDPTEHAIAAIFNSVTIYGIFERQFLERHGVQTSAPTFLGRKSDLAAVTVGASITINSVVYTVREYEHDPDVPHLPDCTMLHLST
jgi:hypothetical protein